MMDGRKIRTIQIKQKQRKASKLFNIFYLKYFSDIGWLCMENYTEVYTRRRYYAQKTGKVFRSRGDKQKHAVHVFRNFITLVNAFTKKNNLRELKSLSHFSSSIIPSWVLRVSFRLVYRPALVDYRFNPTQACLKSPTCCLRLPRNFYSWKFSRTFLVPSSCPAALPDKLPDIHKNRRSGFFFATKFHQGKYWYPKHVPVNIDMCVPNFAFFFSDSWHIFARKILLGMKNRSVRVRKRACHSDLAIGWISGRPHN